MSKNNHRQNRKPAYADWTVRTTGMVAVLVTGSTFTRDEHGGYTFTDLLGITADFPPGTVLHVMRKDEPEISYPLNLPGAASEEFDDDPRKRGTAAAVKSP